jgi:hypothetical protein
VPEKEKINGVPKATILLWIVPAKAAGRWQLQVEGAEPYRLTLKQAYQMVSGSASAGGRTMPVNIGSLRGSDIHFTVNDGAARRQFRGSVSGNAMQGTVDMGGGRTARWSAKRL